MTQVVVRFAPSPTGPLHIGGVRTALYNYLFARKNGGKFILRIEDTDQGRYVPGAEKYIIESLEWCGIKFDEGVHLGGIHAPYRQSERKDLYRQYAEKLVNEGYAYYAFDTAEDLDKLRKDAEAEKKTFQYGPKSRAGLNNSLHLSKEEIAEKLNSGIHFVIRIKIPENEKIVVNDLIRGIVTVESDLLDDKVLFKSDGMPTYHLANVVDDYLMEVTHVIRGEEWLPSAPLHVLLYRYLGWETKMPQFAHLPLLLKPDGNGKLSKRDGDRLGFPVFPLQWNDPFSNEISSGYREGGYLPEAFINMLALLGWNPGTEQEIFSLSELVEAFSLERCSKSGAKFDPEKAKWFNHQYISHKPDEELAGILLNQAKEHGIESNPEFILKIIPLIKSRAILLPDLWKESMFFFLDPESYDEAVKAKIWKPETAQLVTDFISFIENAEFTDVHSIETTVKEFTQQKGIGMGQLMNPIRLLIVGTNAGPGMMDTMLVIGKKRIIEIIKNGLNKLN